MTTYRHALFHYLIFLSSGIYCIDLFAKGNFPIGARNAIDVTNKATSSRAQKPI